MRGSERNGLKELMTIVDNFGGTKRCEINSGKINACSQGPLHWLHELDIKTAIMGLSGQFHCRIFGEMMFGETIDHSSWHEERNIRVDDN
jgi:hypothetical protein